MIRNTLKQNYYYLPYNKNLKDRAKELLKNQTMPEIKIYEEYLSKLKFRVRKQKIIDNFIVDFYIPKLKLVIEIDGEIHNNQKEYDKERTILLNKYNLKLIRIKNKDIFERNNKVYKELDSLIDKLNSSTRKN